jgi:hypothetical protein
MLGSPCAEHGTVALADCMPCLEASQRAAQRALRSINYAIRVLGRRSEACGEP